MPALMDGSSSISAADPLNLAGVVTAGDRIRTAARSRMVYRDGVPLAVREGDAMRTLSTVDAPLAAAVARALGVRRACQLQMANAEGRN